MRFELLPAAGVAAAFMTPCSQRSEAVCDDLAAGTMTRPLACHHECRRYPGALLAGCKNLNLTLSQDNSAIVAYTGKQWHYLVGHVTFLHKF